MHKGVAVLGNKNNIYGFSLVGAAIFPINSETEAKEVFDKVVKEGYSVVFIEEGYAVSLSGDIEKTYNKTTASVVVIPDLKGGTGFGNTSLRAATIRAVGTDILGDE